MDSDPLASKRPRWWIAGLLNLVTWVGVGYLYLGRPRRALVAIATNMLGLAVLWHGLGGWLAEPWIMFAAVGLMISLVVAFAVDAVLIARQGSFSSSWYNRWWIYLAVAVAGYASTSLVDVKRSVRPFVTPSASMEPTLRVGEHFFADMKAFGRREPERGDVVIFELPRDRATIYVKRVIGLPGDEVQVKDGIVHINGAALPTEVIGPYAYVGSGTGETKQQGVLKREALGSGRSVVVLDATASSFFDNTPVFKVPAGQYFVLGDNRDNSTDSRDQSLRLGVGYVPRANIIGKIVWIYWPRDLARIGTRVD